MLTHREYILQLFLYTECSDMQRLYALKLKLGCHHTWGNEVHIKSSKQKYTAAVFPATAVHNFPRCLLVD